MVRLPVITGFGGINAAGRSSGHHGYRRMVIDALPSAQVQATYHSLAALTGQLKKSDGKWTDGNGVQVNLDEYLAQLGPSLKQGTLIRGLENNLFDPDLLPYLRNATLGSASDQPLEFTLRKKDLPTPLPSGWSVSEPDLEGRVRVSTAENIEVSLKCSRETAVHS
ncbi:MAG: acetoacetyl-[acyl-carrier protein] synthase, partial [Pseudohongiellaceae bacterium]